MKIRVMQEHFEQKYEKILKTCMSVNFNQTFINIFTNIKRIRGKFKEFLGIFAKNLQILYKKVTIIF